MKRKIFEEIVEIDCSGEQAPAALAQLGHMLLPSLDLKQFTQLQLEQPHTPRVVLRPPQHQKNGD